MVIRKLYIFQPAYRQLAKTALRQWRLIAAVSGFTVVSIGLLSLSPWPYKLLVDNVLGNELIDTGTFLGKLLTMLPDQAEYLGAVVVGLFFVTSVVSSVVDYLQSVLSSRLSRNVTYGYAREAFAEIEKRSLREFRAQKTGDYIYRLTADTTAAGTLITAGVIPLFSAVISLAVIAWILLSIDVRLTLISFWILPFIASLFRYLNKQILKETKQSERKYSSMFSFVEQALTQIRSIQAYQQEKRELSAYSEKLDASLTSDYRVDVYNLLINLSTGAFIGIGYAVIVGIGISMVREGALTAGLLIVFIFYIDNLTGPMLSIIDSVTAIRQATVRITHLNTVFDPSHRLKDTGTVTRVVPGPISFENVSFTGEKNKKIIDEATFIIPPNGITAVIGISGSGKTTITSMIPRFTEPDSGTIRIGPHKITDYTLRALRSAVTYVSQDSVLFDGTVRETIAFGTPEATDRKIHEAARLAAAHDFIMKHQGGYDFRVGEGGNLLSGGQKQRLLLARGYLRQAPFLILDEIFSAQDPYTKSLMIKNLRQLATGCTVILVTNILDVIRDEDMAVVVDNGQVVYNGKFGELKGRKGKLKLLLGQIAKEGGE